MSEDVPRAVVYVGLSCLSRGYGTFHSLMLQVSEDVPNVPRARLKLLK